MSRRVHLLFLICLGVGLLGACDPLEERSGGSVDLPTGEGWDYPYHLIIGGGLSETLSVLTVRGEGEYQLRNDVALTGSAITDTVLYEGEIYAVCSLSNSVVVYDVADLSITREISLGYSLNPMAIAFDDQGLAWIPNLFSNDVRAYDLSAGTKDDHRLQAVIPMPEGEELPADPGATGYARPGDVVVMGGRLIVACANVGGTYEASGPGLLVEIDIPTRTRLRQVELSGRNPIGMSLVEDVLLVACAGDYDGGFVGNGLVEVLDAQTLQSLAVINTGNAPFGVTSAPWERLYFENGARGSILVADPKSYSPLDSIPLASGEGPGVSFASGLAADGRGFLYALEFNHDKLYVFDSKQGMEVIASFTVNDGPDTLLILHGGEGP